MSYISNTAPNFKQMVKDILALTKVEVSDIDAFIESLEGLIYQDSSINLKFKKHIKPNIE